MHVRGAGVPPGSASCGRRLACTVRPNAQSYQLSTSGLRFTPLLPQDLAEASAYPLIQEVERLLDGGQTKVAKPSSKVLVDLLDHLLDVSSPPSLRNLPYPILRSIHRGRCWFQSGQTVIGHRVTQKLSFPRSVHGALVAVHPQTQFDLQEMRH